MRCLVIIRVLYLVDIFNQDYFDFDMCQAIQAALQVMSFHLPTFKSSNKGTSTTGGTRAGNILSTEPIHLNFILSKQSDENYNSNSQDGYISSAVDHNTAELINKYEKILAVTKHINQGTNLARALSSLPPNVLNPASYTKLLREFTSCYDLDYTEWTPSELKTLGCGAFYAVTQGNGEDKEKTDRLVRIKYSPTNNGDEDNSYWATTTSNNNAVTRTTDLSTEASVNSNNSDDVDDDTLSLADILSRRRAQLASSTSATTASTTMSSEAPRLRLTTFQQQKQAQKPLVLVGKGVCYDTGNVMYFTYVLHCLLTYLLFFNDKVESISRQPTP